MNYSRQEIKLRAKDKLKGNFGMAILTCMIYSLILSAVAGIFAGPSVTKTIKTIVDREQPQSYAGSFSFAEDGEPNTDFNASADELFNSFGLNDGASADSSQIISAIQENYNPLSSLGTLVTLLITGPLALGLAAFFLRLIRIREAELEELFSGFKNGLGQSVLLSVLIWIFTLLWSLLFLIPGIIAGLRYSMAYYILADNPGMKAKDALDQSKAMMKGNCGKYFVLELSFIGWVLLSCLTLGIGFIFLTPYMEAAKTEFYQEISGKNSIPAAAGTDGFVNPEPFAASTEGEF